MMNPVMLVVAILSVLSLIFASLASLSPQKARVETAVILLSLAVVVLAVAALAR